MKKIIIREAVSLVIAILTFATLSYIFSMNEWMFGVGIYAGIRIGYWNGRLDKDNED